MNHKFKMEEDPTLISGIADFVQIYASHATFVYKNLLSINLNIVNTAPFKIDDLIVKVK